MIHRAQIPVEDLGFIPVVGDRVGVGYAQIITESLSHGASLMGLTPVGDLVELCGMPVFVHDHVSVLGIIDPS